MNQFLGLLCVLLSTTVFADEVVVGTPAFGGDGCLHEKTSLVISPDRKTVRLLPTDYVAEAGGNTGRGIDQKSCDLAIPVHIPKGYQVGFRPKAFNGTVSLGEKSRSVLTAEYFLAGSRGVTFNQNFKGPLSQEFVSETEDKLIWSPCGTDTILRLNTSIYVKTTPAFEPVRMSIDEIAEFQIYTQQCL